MKPLAKRAFKGRRSERAASCGDRLRAERAMDRPDEAGQLARDSGHCDGLQLAFPDQRPIARREPRLGFPGDALRRRRRSLDPLGTPEGQRAMNQAIDDFNRY